MISDLVQSAVESGFGFWGVLTAVLVGAFITISRRGSAARSSLDIDDSLSRRPRGAHRY